MKVKHLLHCHLLVTGMSGQVVDAAPRLPGLEALLALSGANETEADGVVAWLCRNSGVARQRDWPVAPFAALGDGLDPAGCYWLHADPVHLHLLRDRIVLDGTSPHISAGEALELTRSLNQHFNADGLRFTVAGSGRWYLSLAAEPDLRTCTLAEAAGKDVTQCLPEGGDAMRWHGWLNEVQMLLHEHPVNLAREERGELPVNSLWPWGGGVLADPGEPAFEAAWAQSPLIRGLMQAGGREAGYLPACVREWLEQAPAEGGHLLALELPATSLALGDDDGWKEALMQLEKNWFAPLLAYLESGEIVSVHLHLATHDRVMSFETTRDGLWKFWRRPKPIGHYLHG